ncbi:hypothetical protein M3Y98_00908600 [Aphelenchoides besseyi]|nr:hypothetical protein M3Y98_00908600 [Aphelenchoides besseyi]
MSVETQVQQPKVVFVLNNGEKIEAEESLNETSGFLKDFLLTFKKDEFEEVEIPLSCANSEEVCLLNKFSKYLADTHKADMLEKAFVLEHWMTEVPSKKDELLPLAEDVDKDVLIRASNLGDFLINHSFMAFCTYVISERCKNFTLAELREYLNEENDFDAEQMEIIRSCPEFANL